MAEKRTPREEFEAEFVGPIDDEEWEWLKRFFARNHVCDRRTGVVGYRVAGRIYHPYVVELILEDE